LIKSENDLFDGLKELDRVHMNDEKYHDIWLSLSTKIQDQKPARRRSRRGNTWLSLMAAIVAVLVVGVGIGAYHYQHSRGSSITASGVATLLKAVPQSDMQKFETTLKQFPQIRLPQTLPFTVTGVSATVMSPDSSAKTKQIQIYFINTSTKDVLQESVLTHTATVGDANKIITLKNGTKAYYSANQYSRTLSWNENGYYYVITSSGGSSGGKLLDESTLENLANGMQ
jgi:flagellar basal body-associated protein FliL